MKRRAPFDVTLLSIAVILTVLGLMTLYSSSAILADRELGDPFFYLKRQAAWAAAGFLSLAFLSRLNVNRLREWVWPLMLITITVLAAVLFSAPVAGAKRWIRFAGLGFQPAEFAKLSMVLFTADYLDRKRSKLSTLMQGMIVPWAVIGLILVLIGLEPDLGTPALLFVVGMLLLFIGGTRPAHLAGMLACAVPALIFEIMRLPYRRERLMNFLQPFSDAQGVGYQLSQSLMAVGSGGWFGKGLGASRLKLMHLPKPHTDFIFPVLCEELGMLGATLVLGLFAALLLRGVRIARRAPDLYGTLLATGLTLIITLQAFFNIAMSIGLLPTKGLPLPFFSYGGSSMLVTLSAVGMLLNISRQPTAKRPVRR